MRRNHFGDAYCTDAKELLNELQEKEHHPSTVYVAYVEASEGEEKTFIAEVVENDSGDTVCYIEADTAEAVKAIIKEAGIEDQS